MNVLMLILLVVMTFMAGLGTGIIAPVLVTMAKHNKAKKKPAQSKQTNEEVRRHLKAQKELENFYAYDGTVQDEITV